MKRRNSIIYQEGTKDKNNHDHCSLDYHPSFYGSSPAQESQKGTTSIGIGTEEPPRSRRRMKRRCSKVGRMFDINSLDSFAFPPEEDKHSIIASILANVNSRSLSQVKQQPSTPQGQDKIRPLCVDTIAAKRRSSYTEKRAPSRRSSFSDDQSSSLLQLGLTI